MSVWTRPEDDYLPLVPSEWREAAQRWLARTMVQLRLPLALTGGLFAALGVLLMLTPDPPPPAAGGDIGAGAWTRQTLLSPRVTLRAAGPVDVGTWSRETNEGRETEDRLTAGSVDGGPYLRVVATRRPAAAPASGFFVASVRTAANAGLSVARFGRASDHSGRFGATETALVSLIDPGQRVQRTDCLAWRADDQEIVLAGFFCPGSGLAVDAAALECVLRDVATTADSDALLRQVLKPRSSTMTCKAAIADAGRAGLTRSVATTRQ